MSSLLSNELSKPGEREAGTARRRSNRSGWALLAVLVRSVVVAAFVVVVTFFLIRYLLGDPAYQYAMARNGGQPPNPQAVEIARHQLGVDAPILEQFWRYVTGLSHGDLGASFQPGRLPVGTLVWSGLSTTLVLSALTVVLSTVLGTVLGLWLATVRFRPLDSSVRIVAMAGIAAPPALVGLVLIWLSSATGDVLPAGGWGHGYPENFRYLVLPVLALSVGFVSVILRVVRERARATLAQDHIEAARTRGISRRTLLIRHVLPECMVPLLRFLALNTALLLSWAVVVEVVFGVPGLGRVLLAAVHANDYPTIQACAMLTGLVVVVLFAAAQIAGAMIDPRTRQ